MLSLSYEADADVVMSVLALQPLLSHRRTKLVVEVSKTSTAELLRSIPALRINPVENLSPKLFVQCARQPGLVDVYCCLLDHAGEGKQDAWYDTIPLVSTAA